MRGIAGLLVAAFMGVAPALAEGQTFQPSAVLDATVGDWNRDGHDDLALLAFSGPEDDMEIGVYIYLRDGERGMLDLALEAPGVVWGGREMYGQEPSVRTLPNGSLAVHTQNFAIGRERWEHTISVAHRNGRFVVAGLTFSSFDSLQEYEAVECDLNLLTGKGVLNGKQISFKRLDLELSQWSTNDDGEDPGVAICRKK